MSTVGGYRSALVWFYREHNSRIEVELDAAIANYIAGFKRNVTTLKQNGFRKVQEGRSPVSFTGYRLLAYDIATQKPEGRSSNWTSTFAWPFFVLCWNLMARSVSVGDMMLQHLKWKQDSLVCQLPKHKGDQSGTKIIDRHVFANPLEPVICPVLALAVLLFCKPFRSLDGLQQVFESMRSENRFSEILASLLNKLSITVNKVLEQALMMLGHIV